MLAVLALTCPFLYDLTPLFTYLENQLLLLVVQIPIHSSPWFAINCSPLAANGKTETAYFRFFSANGKLKFVFTRLQTINGNRCWLCEQMYPSMVACYSLSLVFLSICPILCKSLVQCSPILFFKILLLPCAILLVHLFNILNICLFNILKPCSIFPTIAVDHICISLKL